MSNKQKYLSVLALIAQSKVKTPKEAWKISEKMFDESMGKIVQISHEEQMEMLCYAMTSLWFLSTAQENTLLHDVIMDDLRTRMHELTCPNCKGEAKEAACGTAMRDDDEDEEHGPKIIAAGSLDEVISQLMSKTGKLS